MAHTITATAVEYDKRKPTYLYAFASDGTVWRLRIDRNESPSEYEWEELPSITLH